MTSKNYREKRRFPRVSVQFDVVYKVNTPLEIRMKVGDEERKASLVNISEVGIAILTDEEIPEGTELEMLFRLVIKEIKTPTIYVVGRVRNVAALDKEYRLGIEFINIHDLDRLTINDFVKSCISSPSS